jgi:allantoate deiminase
MTGMDDLTAAPLMDRLDMLATCSEHPQFLQRTYLSEAYRRAADLVADWMRQAGMSTRMDAVGNVIGLYEGEPGAPSLLLGSHLDTVRDAGKYDGPLGIVAAIACIARLHRARRRMPYAIEVVAFSEEEGVRFGTTLLGSRAIAGTFDMRDLDRTDAQGVTLREAITTFGLDPNEIPAAAYAPERVIGYVELHIEQGPVLEQKDLSVGIVDAISGAARYLVDVRGTAGHAGTVPMEERRDALAAAASCITGVERRCSCEPGLVGTVGCVEVINAAINVIAGHVRFTVDVRAPDDKQRAACELDMLQDFQAVATARRVSISVKKIYDVAAMPCAPWLVTQIADAILTQGVEPFQLPSGAGHDGLALRTIADVGMIFVRCAGGISHNPAESITAADAECGARVLAQFIDRFRPA